MRKLVIISLFLMQNLYADDVYEDIIERKEIRVGVHEYFPPLSFQQDDVYTGVDIEIARQFADYLGVKIKYVPMSLQEFDDSVKTGRVDVIIGGFTRTLRRGKKFWFSKPYLEVTPGVVLDKRKLPQSNFGETFEKDTIKNIQDLRRLSKLELGVQTGSSHEELFSSRLPGKKFVSFTTNEDCIEALLDGKVAGCIADSVYLEYIMERNNSLARACVLLQGGSEIDRIAFAFAPGDEEMVYVTNFFIEEMRQSGRIEKIMKKYLKLR